MIDYSEHAAVLKALKADQEADYDRREMMREIHAFLHHKDGQWDPSIRNKFSNRFVGTFDRCTALVEDTWADMAKNEAEIKIRPKGDGATKENANYYSGLIRNIEDFSNADDAYKQAGKLAIEVGFSCVSVDHDYIDADSFDQDLIIKDEPDAIDRIWFEAGFTKPTAEDANHVHVHFNIPLHEFEEKYKRPPQSIDKDGNCERYFYKANGVTVCRIFWKEAIDRTLYKMSNGEVYSEEDKPIFDELALRGITVVASRKRKKIVVKRRLYDAKGWLGDAEDTPFKLLPYIPNLPNFRIAEGKVLSRGIVEKRMDEQRVLNYAGSRAVDDLALSAKEKIWISVEQSEDVESELKSYATSAAPIQRYKAAGGPTPPFKMPGPQGSGGLQQLLEFTEASIERGSGKFGTNPQNNSGLQSDIALQRLENRGNNGTYEYFCSQEVMIQHVAKVCIGSIPSVYDAEREIRILNRDGSHDEITLHKRIVDRQTGKVHEPIDLSVGVYDAICSIGPAYENKRQETNDFIMRLADVDPSIIEEGKDILLNNIDSPGMDILAERVRRNKVLSGSIPEEQLTDDEKEMLQEQSQQQSELVDPAMLIGQAEIKKANTEAETAEVNREIKVIELQQKQDKQEFDNSVRSIELMLEEQKQVAQTLKDLASAFKQIQEGEQIGSEDLNAEQSIEGQIQQATNQ